MPSTASGCKMTRYPSATGNTVPFAEPGEDLGRGFTFTAIHLFQSAPNAFYGVGPIQPVEQGLVTLGVLDDELRSAVDRQHDGGPSPLHLRDELCRPALEIRERLDVAV